MTEEARDRIERFRRKKLHEPLKWSDKQWSETCAGLAKLAAEFPDEPGHQTASPVAKY
jgi:hypothetical protein